MEDSKYDIYWEKRIISFSSTQYLYFKKKSITFLTIDQVSKCMFGPFEVFHVSIVFDYFPISVDIVEVDRMHHLNVPCVYVRVHLRPIDVFSKSLAISFCHFLHLCSSRRSKMFYVHLLFGGPIQIKTQEIQFKLFFFSLQNENYVGKIDRKTVVLQQQTDKKTMCLQMSANYPFIAKIFAQEKPTKHGEPFIFSLFYILFLWMHLKRKEKNPFARVSFFLSWFWQNVQVYNNRSHINGVL